MARKEVDNVRNRLGLTGKTVGLHGLVRLHLGEGPLHVVGHVREDAVRVDAIASNGKLIGLAVHSDTHGQAANGRFCCTVGNEMGVAR